MVIFFDILKGIFFFFTVLVGLFFLRGDIVLGHKYYEILKEILMPGYLLFCGLMVGYLVSHIRISGNEDENIVKKIYVRSFIIGVISGIILAILYMVV